MDTSTPTPHPRCRFHASVFVAVVVTTGSLGAFGPFAPRALAQQQSSSGSMTAMGRTNQTAPAMIRSVLLFPPVMAGGSGGGDATAAPATPAAGAEMSPSARMLQESLVDAMRKALNKSGVSATVYNRRLPSIQRAVGETTLKADEAAAGLRDGSDSARAQRLADIIGATSYIIPEIDAYKYDSATRTVTFNLSAQHFTTAGGGASLGLSAESGKGEAPADVPNSLQEGSAIARAAEATAERVVAGLFPRPPQEDTKKIERRAVQRTGTPRWVLPAFGGLLGLLAITSDN